MGLINYRKQGSLFFTYLNFEIIRKNWPLRIEDLESYFIFDFVQKIGVYPICNNKIGPEIEREKLNIALKIDWKYFQET